MFNHQIRSRLDLMVPEPTDPAKPVEGKVYDLPEGARVAAMDYIDRTKWKYGVITEKLWKLHNILLDDGRTWKRHIDQVRKIGSNLPDERCVLAVVFPEEPAHPSIPDHPGSRTATAKSRVAFQSSYVHTSCHDDRVGLFVLQTDSTCE